MPRITPLSRRDAGEDVLPFFERIFGDRDPAVQPGSPTGTPGDWWTAWAKTPGILKAFSAYPMGEAPLDPKLRELAIVRTGYARGSQFVFSQHSKAARREGVAEDKIRAVPYWTISPLFDARERAVLAYVDGMILEGGRVHDEVFAALKAAIPEEHILMLTYFVNMYAMHATATKALRLEYDNVPDRIVEIPEPPNGGVQDWRDPKWAENG